jgi:hypothetical protein
MQDNLLFPSYLRFGSVDFSDGVANLGATQEALKNFNCTFIISKYIRYR